MRMPHIQQPICVGRHKIPRRIPYPRVPPLLAQDEYQTARLLDLGGHYVKFVAFCGAALLPVQGEATEDKCGSLCVCQYYCGDIIDDCRRWRSDHLIAEG